MPAEQWYNVQTKKDKSIILSEEFVGPNASPHEHLIALGTVRRLLMISSRRIENSGRVWQGILPSY
jgi:hypothetical protein